MAINLTPDVEVTRDEYQKVRALDHPRQPFIGEAGARESVAALADAYLAEVASIYEISPKALRNLEPGDSDVNPDESEQLTRTDVAQLPGGSATVAYAQKLFNLDVWEAGV